MHAFTKDHKSSIEKYFQGLLYIPIKIKTAGNNKLAHMVSTLIFSKKFKRIQLEILIANPAKIKSIVIAMIVFIFKKFFILNYFFFEKTYIKRMNTRIML